VIQGSLDQWISFGADLGLEDMRGASSGHKGASSSSVWALRSTIADTGVGETGVETSKRAWNGRRITKAEDGRQICLRDGLEGPFTNRKPITPGQPGLSKQNIEEREGREPALDHAVESFDNSFLSIKLKAIGHGNRDLLSEIAYSNSEEQHLRLMLT